jgi:hypothetical protein
MSRGTKRKERQDADWYPTPEWCTRRLLEVPGLPTFGTWLEPAVGDGAIMRVVRDTYPDITWHTNDIRPESLLHAGIYHTATHYTGDFLALAPCITEKYSCIITNPPFSLAMEFVKASLPITYSVIMLLRLGFLESSDRNAWIRQNMPHYIYVLPNRQGGTADGKTDVFTYAWFHWTPEWDHGALKPVTESTIMVLPDTPILERKRDRGKLASNRDV